MLEAARDRCLQKVLFMHMCRWSYGSLPTFLGRTSVRMFSDTFHFTCDRFFGAKLISSRSPHYVTSVDTGDDRTFMVLSTSFVLWITLHLLPTRCALRRQYLHRKVFDDAESSFHKAFFLIFSRITSCSAKMKALDSSFSTCLARRSRSRALSYKQRTSRGKISKVAKSSTPPSASSLPMMRPSQALSADDQDSP